MAKNGETPEFLFFFGALRRIKPLFPESECLSQWFRAPFVHEKVLYETAEHWMMAQKAILFNDHEMRERILQVRTPKEAKALGRKIRNFSEDVWSNHKVDIVFKGNVLKFKQNKVCRDFLLGTYPKVLVEASPYDRIWGIGMSARDTGVQNPENWKGRNLLGFILTRVRETIGKEMEEKNNMDEEKGKERVD